MEGVSAHEDSARKAALKPEKSHSIRLILNLAGSEDQSVVSVELQP